MTKRGKFVVIEGVDGSGKSTQFELLKKKLIKSGYKVKTVDFPRYYSSIWGRMVGKFLKGEYGDFDGVNPYLVVLMYMLDQYTWSRDVGEEILRKGQIILSNRYFTSNVHQIAKLEGKEREEYRRWLWPAGYKHLRLLKPDLVLFLDVEPRIAVLMNKTKRDRKYLKGEKEDEAEKRFYHQKSAYREYLKTVKQFKYWTRVKCMTGRKIDTPKKIHARIWSIVKKYL